MATVATLGVSLTARTGSFEKGFKRAQKIAARFSSDIASHVATITRYGAALSAVALGAASVLVRGQLEAVDATSKLSRTLGVSTENLVGYQHAAKLAGVDSEKLAAGILKINKTAEGAFAGLSTDERILAIADQYQSIGNAAERAAFLTKTFGKSGLEMGAFFEQGSAGILAARKEAERLGLTFSASEGQMVENANDAATRIGEAFAGMGRRLAIEVAPYIEAISARILAFAENVNTTGGVFSAVFDFIAVGASKIASMLALLEAAWFSFVAAVSGSAFVITQAMETLTDSKPDSFWEAVFGGTTLGQMAGLGRKMLGAIGPDVENLNKMFSDMSEGFAKKSVDAAKKASGALEEYASGSAMQSVLDKFEAVKVEAAKIAEAAGSASGSASGSGGDAAKSSEFRQVDLERVFIGKTSGNAAPAESKGEQQIIKRLDTTNSFLSVLVTKAGRPVLI